MSLQSSHVISDPTETSPYRMYEIMPQLYLSRFPKEIPAQVTHVLNMCIESNPKDTTRTYMQVPIYDFDNITPYIKDILNFIDGAMESGGVVLVHCAMGINRSAAATLSYLCHHNQITSAEALKIVKSIKPDVMPSTVFLKQIDLFFGRSGGGEDPLTGFHQRLQARKDAARKEET